MVQRLQCRTCLSASGFTAGSETVWKSRLPTSLLELHKMGSTRWTTMRYIFESTGVGEELDILFLECSAPQQRLNPTHPAVSNWVPGFLLGANSPSDATTRRVSGRVPRPSSRTILPASFPPHTTRRANECERGYGCIRVVRGQRGNTVGRWLRHFVFVRFILFAILHDTPNELCCKSSMHKSMERS